MEIIKKYLTKPESPLPSTPQCIKTVFNAWFNKQSFVIPNTFSLAPSQTNKCTKIFKKDDLYYECFQCVVENTTKSYSFYLCTECFIPEQHQGHFYKCDVISYFDRGIYCSCGKDLNGEDSIINYCTHHIDKDIDIEIPETLFTEFTNYFKPFYQILFYLDKLNLEENQSEHQFQEEVKKIFEQLHRVLSQLTHNSLIYIRMWTKLLLKQKIKSKHLKEGQQQELSQQTKIHESTIFQFVLLFKGMVLMESSKIFLNVLSDNQSSYQMLPALDQLIMQGHEIRILQRLSLQMRYVSWRIIERLSRQKKYLNFVFHPTYTIYSKRKNTSQIFMDMAKNILSEDDDKTRSTNIIADYFQKSYTYYLNQEDVIFILKYFTDLFISNSQLRQKNHQQINGNQQKQQQNQKQVQFERENSQRSNNKAQSENEIAEIRNQNIQNNNNRAFLSLKLQQGQLQQVSMYSQVIGEQIYTIFRGQTHRIIECRKYLGENGININKLQTFLSWAIENINLGSSLELIPSKFVITSIMLISQSPDSQVLIQKIWNSIFNQSDLDQILKNIWSLIFLLTDRIMLRWTNRSVCFKQTFDMMLEDDNNINITNQTIEKIDQMQLQYMYQFKEIPQAELSQLRLILENKKFGVLVQQYMQYDRQRNVFTYHSQELHENKMIILLKALETLKSNAVKNFLYQQDQQTYSKMKPEKQCQRDFRQKLFIKSNFFEKIQQLWSSVIIRLNDNQNHIELLKQNKKLESYLQILVIINNLCEGKFDKLKQYLEGIRNNNDKLAEFYILGNSDQINQILSIKKLKNPEESDLLIKQHKQGINSQISANISSCDPQFKKKSDEKKCKISQKFKEQRKKAIQNLSTNSMSLAAGVSLEQQQQCLFCHEKGKVDNQMVYMLDIVKDSTLCSAIFQDKNCAKTFLTSCFHSMHVKCFLKAKGTNRYLRCPLCTKPQNCIFPVNYDSNNKKLNTICENIMKVAVISIYNIFDVGNWFLMFLQYLLEAKAFHSLMNIQKYQVKKKKREKLNSFVQGMLQKIYQNGNQLQKGYYNQNIQLLNKKINQCQDEDFKIIQKVMFDALVSKIKSGSSEINSKELQFLAKRINRNQIMIIRNQIQDLGYQPIQIHSEEFPQNNISEKKSVSFSLKKLPETWDQIPKLGGQGCAYCKSIQKSLFCLICGQTLCKKCEEQQPHQKKHQKRSISFLFYESTLSLKTQCSSLQSDIYFNEIQTSIRKWDESSMTYDTFRLDEKIIDKLGELFMNDT